jgi:hypothetical protein
VTRPTSAFVKFRIAVNIYMAVLVPADSGSARSPNRKMKKNNATQKSAEPEGVRQRLLDLRNALLHLHKMLLESERVSYEATIGAIQSPNHFLQLLTSDPWFAWLHPISQLIVAMDEALDSKEPLTAETAEALTKQARQLLVASENDEGFARHYFDALQRDPDVIFAHAEVSKLNGAKKKRG